MPASVKLPKWIPVIAPALADSSADLDKAYKFAPLKLKVASENPLVLM